MKELTNELFMQAIDESLKKVLTKYYGISDFKFSPYPEFHGGPIKDQIDLVESVNWDSFHAGATLMKKAIALGLVTNEMVEAWQHEIKEQEQPND